MNNIWYLIVLGFVTCCMLIVSYSVRINNKLIKLDHVFFVFAFFALSIFSSIRFNVGIDYYTYYNIYQNKWYENSEFLYRWLNQFADHFNLGFVFVVSVMSILTFIFLFLFIKELPQKLQWLAVIMIFISGYLFYIFNIMRQGLSVAIFLYSTKYIYNKSFLKYLFWIFIASLFHFSALFLIPFYVLYKFTFNKISLLIIYAACAGLMFTGIAEKLLTNLLSLIPKYKIYLNTTFAENLKLSTGLGYLSRQLIGLFIILLYPQIINQFGLKSKIYTNLLIIGIFLSFLFFQVRILDRFVDYFKFFFIPVIPYTIYSFKRKTNKVIIGYVLIGIFIVLYVKTSFFHLPSDQLDYQTIFSK